MTEQQSSSPVSVSLLPCPFCGSSSVDPEGWMSCEPDGSDKRTGPACDDCGASASSDERWNTRDWSPDDARSSAATATAADEMRRAEAELRASSNGDCNAAAQAIMWYKKAAALDEAARALNPRVVDNDHDEITVSLNGKELRGWSYKDDAERRTKMLAAREYVEGYCDGRDA